MEKNCLEEAGLPKKTTSKRAPSKRKKNNKIVRYRRPLNINVGVIIFAIIFIYMSFSVYTYIKKDKIQFYEVVEGDIVNDYRYDGIILRQEVVQFADQPGFIHYYVRDGKRAAVGSPIYSIDQIGSLSSFLEDKTESNTIFTNENLSEIKRRLSSFALTYSDMAFDEVYGLQTSLDAAVLEYVNFNTLESLDSMMEQAGVTLQHVFAPVSGVVSYGIDGYEGRDFSQPSAADFDTSGYSRAITKAGQWIEAADPVYKLVTSDDWSIFFPIGEDQKEEFADRTRLHVIFKSRNLETEGAFSLITGSDGETYGRLDFNQYMVQFINDRFIHFEVKAEKNDGLKIPVTSVTTKDFFLVPVDYITQGGDSSDTGFLKEVYSENGTSAEFTPVSIYNSTDEYYYIDMGENSPFSAGDYIIKPDSGERYQIGPSDTLQGVYNINKGYTIFKLIEILNFNDEYYTIRKGMNYGLSVYDHIVLDANTVYEGQLIYQ